MKYAMLLVLAAVICVGAAGCAVYSEQNYGPQNIGSINTLDECLRKAGGPDLMHSSAGKTVLVYRSIAAMEVLGIYGYVDKKDRVIAFDANGKQVSDEVVSKGQGMFIIGVMSPAFETE